MFPLIGPLATFLAGSAGFTGLDALIRLLLSKGNRAAVGALTRRLTGKTPKSFVGSMGLGGVQKFAENPAAAGKTLQKSLGQSAKLGASFGALDTAVRGAAGEFGSTASNNAFLQPTLALGAEAGGGASFDEILALLAQSQGAPGAVPTSVFR